MKLFKKLDKKGESGIVTGLVMGVASLVVAVVIALIIVSTLRGSSLLTSGSVEQNATDNLAGNFSVGINNVSEKVPTVFSVAIIVLILGVLVFLVAIWKKMQMGGGGGSI